MKPFLFRLAISFRKELLICLGVIFLLISLPILAVIEIANGGVAAASSTLARVDPVTQIGRAHV